MKFLIDKAHRLPRIWSNRELAKFAHLFHGDVVNVSAWKDIDKEGRRYQSYFRNSNSYTLTNYKADARGFQGMENEIFLDLETELPGELLQRFDVVFNHTTLEHIYAFQAAFKNLCLLSKDIVIIVVPFLQAYHSGYGDYWRFTPLSLKRMFEDNGYGILYLSCNSHLMSSVYIFSIASRNPEKWKENFDYSFSFADPQGRGHEPDIGSSAIPNYGHRLKMYLKGLLS